MRFRRRKDEPQEGVADEAVAPAEDAPDPSTWALPADAAVAAGGDVAEPQTEESDVVAPAPETAAGLSAVSVTSPGIGSTSEPAAAAAAAQPPRGSPEPAAAPEPGAGAATMSFGGDAGQQRPEVLVAGAFVGAFLIAKILKRLSD